MNLDQQIRRRLIADEEGRYPGSLTGKVFELTTAIRAVLHETARWREGSVHGTPAGLALQLEGLIAAHLGITEKQDETDTGLCPAEFAGERAGSRYACTETAGHPGTHKATSVGGRTVLAEWTDRGQGWIR